jgi:hypothetical protein
VIRPARYRTADIRNLKRRCTDVEGERRTPHQRTVPGSGLAGSGGGTATASRVAIGYTRRCKRQAHQSQAMQIHGLRSGPDYRSCMAAAYGRLDLDLWSSRCFPKAVAEPRCSVGFLESKGFRYRPVSARSERFDITQAACPKPVTRIVEQNSSYNQSLTASDPSSPQFTCHNGAAMRFPNRIPASNATSPTAPPRVLVPVETLPAKPQIEKNEKVFFPSDPNFRSDKCRANLNLAPASTHPGKPENGKNKKMKISKQSEPNPGQIPGKSGPARLTPGISNDIVFDSYSQAGE